jgi:NAD(P)-dependent dehydrogenase (short-subunit alcohol dehydrogenase family)
MISSTAGARSALITGASRGIGNAIAHRLASMGFRLTVSSRKQADLEPLAENLRRVGAPKVVAHAADMSDLEALPGLVDAHGEAFGAMNLLVLNAGVGTAGNLADSELRRIRKVLEVNLTGSIVLLQAAVPLLRAGAQADPGRGSRVIGLSSITGDYAETGLAAYGASKAALSSLLTSVGWEEAENGINATSIAPGYVETDMSAWVTDAIPADTMIRDEDVASVVEMLAGLSREAVIDHVPITRRLGGPYRA